MIAANPLLPPCNGAGQNPDGSAYYQGTKEHFLNLEGIDTSLPELEYIAIAINTKGPFTCDQGQQMVFLTSIPLPRTAEPIPTDYSILKRYYRLKPNLTSVGANGNPIIEDPNLISSADLMADGRIEIDFSEEGASVLFIDLGDIGAGPVETAFNLGQPITLHAWEITGERFITAILNGDHVIYRFIGGLGFWGGSAGGPYPSPVQTATALDFDLLTNQPAPPPNYLETKPADTFGAVINAIALDNHEGRYLYRNNPNNSSSFFNTSTEKLGGKAKLKIDTTGKASFPIVNSKYTITLSGTSGTARLTVGANTYDATFATDLTTTAANFVATHAANILANDGLTIIATNGILTASGAAVSVITFANLTGDLAGVLDKIICTNLSGSTFEEAIFDLIIECDYIKTTSPKLSLVDYFFIKR